MKRNRAGKIDLVISGRRPVFLTEQRIRKTLRQTLAVLGKDSAVLGLAFLTPKQMGEKNLIYHHKSGPTDVLSFAYPDERPSVLVGDILLCPSFAVSQAKQAQEQPVRELSRLLIHGLLHLAGLDHAKPTQEKRMFKLQEAVLSKV